MADRPHDVSGIQDTGNPVFDALSNIARSDPQYYATRLCELHAILWKLYHEEPSRMSDEDVKRRLRPSAAMPGAPSP